MTRTTNAAVLVTACVLFAAPARAVDFYAEANPTAEKKEAPPKAPDFYAEANPAAEKKEAASNPDRGVQLGLRTGYGLPAGRQYDADVKLRNDLNGVIPIWVDAGYRLSPAIYVGAYGMFGVGLVNTNSACGLDGVSCSAYDVRIGVDAHYHFIPKGSVDPWFGLGFGYEWMHTAGSGPGGTVSQTLRGVELLGLQIGADFEIDPTFKLGPFLGYSLGKFSDGTTSQTGAVVNGSASAGIANTALHEWLTFGVRGVLNL